MPVSFTLLTTPEHACRVLYQFLPYCHCQKVHAFLDNAHIITSIWASLVSPDGTTFLFFVILLFRYMCFDDGIRVGASLGLRAFLEEGQGPKPRSLGSTLLPRKYLLDPTEVNRCYEDLCEKPWRCQANVEQALSSPSRARRFSWERKKCLSITFTWKRYGRFSVTGTRRWVWRRWYDSEDLCPQKWRQTVFEQEKDIIRLTSQNGASGVGV